MPFKKAEKKGLYLRIAIDGPSGSGKTYTALMLAEVLKGSKRIALIDTEYQSAELYADKFDFDTDKLTFFSVEKYIAAMQEAADTGDYGVLIIDSLTHAWDGIGGVLARKDAIERAMKTPNGYTAWAEANPLQNKLIAAILSWPGHVICTLRSKMEYVMETDSRGKTVVRKVGMAPIQRQGVEYEFTIVGEMDASHNMSISKTRCSLIDGYSQIPDKAVAKTMLDWAQGGGEPTLPAPQVEEPVKSNSAPPAPPIPPPPTIDTAKHNAGVFLKHWNDEGLEDIEVLARLGVKRLSEFGDWSNPQTAVDADWKMSEYKPPTNDKNLADEPDFTELDKAIAKLPSPSDPAPKPNGGKPANERETFLTTTPTQSGALWGPASIPEGPIDSNGYPIKPDQVKAEHSAPKAETEPTNVARRQSTPEAIIEKNAKHRPSAEPANPAATTDGFSPELEEHIKSFMAYLKNVPELCHLTMAAVADALEVFILEDYAGYEWEKSGNYWIDKGALKKIEAYAKKHPAKDKAAQPA